MEIWRSNSLITTLLFMIALAAQCNPSGLNANQVSTQDDAKPVAVFIPSSESELQSKVEGITQPFNPTSVNLKESVLSHPLPEVWLVFYSPVKPDQPQAHRPEGQKLSMRVELPPDARHILLTQWRKVLASKYKEEIEVLPDVQSFKKEDVVIASSTNTARLELTKILIETPDGKRTLSWTEANNLVIFINKAVADVLGQIK